MRAWIRWAGIAGAVSIVALGACSTPFPCAELGGELDYDGTCFYPAPDAAAGSSSSGSPVVVDSGPEPVDSATEPDGAIDPDDATAPGDASAPMDASSLPDASDSDASDASDSDASDASPEP